MSVVISDLVAKVRAEGVEQTAAAVKQVSASAQEAARALEIMAQQAAKSGGGTAPGWMDMFTRQGVQPTAAALAQARSEMEKTAAATQQAVQPAQTVARAATEHAAAAATGARAAQDVADGWKLSESSIVRFGTALVGINLGISLVAGVARQIHEQFVAAVESAVELDRVTRGLTGAYGAAGAQNQAAFAQRLGSQAGVPTGTVETALTSAAPLANQFGLSTGQVQQVTSRAADLAAQYGQPFQKTFNDVLQGISSGGTQLQQYGVRLDDVYVKTIAYNGALSTTYDRMTQAQQIGVRFNQFLDQTRSSQGLASTSANTLSGSLDRLGSSFQRLREQSGALGGGGLQGPAEALNTLINQILGTGQSGDRRAIVADPNAPGGGRIITGSPQFDLTGIPGAVAPAAPPSFIGPVPVRGVDALNAQAQNAQAYAGRAQAEAQAQITALQLESERRRLDMAEELAGYQTDELNTESQLAPLLEQQANLQDRITKASRDNLQTRRELIDAEQQQARATQITSAYDYEAQRLELLAEQSRANVALGGQPTQDIGALRQRNRALELQRAQSGADITALDASRGVQVVQQQSSVEDLARQQRLADLEGEQRALEDQTIPLQEQLRLTQEREASVQRSLQLQDLANTTTLVAAQQASNEANSLRLLADETARVAEDFADHMVAGATALERSASAAAATRDALQQAIILTQSPTRTDLNSRLANGLGSGGLGPTVTVPISINGATEQQIKDQVHQSVETALNSFFAGAATTGSPAPTTVGGAGR